jgi:hypothetical protein
MSPLFPQKNRRFYTNSRLFHTALRISGPTKEKTLWDINRRLIR